MIQAGYKGSSINDVVWMGNVVNNACHLANKAGRNSRKTLVISKVIYDNLSDHNKSFLSSYYDWEEKCTNYEGTIVFKSMKEWLANNK